MSEPGVPLLHWRQAGAAGASVAVTTRHGGVSEPPYDSLNLGLHVGDDPGRVLVNRRRAARDFGVSLGDLVFAQQVHGNSATVVGTTEHGRGTRAVGDAIPDTDILVTATPGTTLVILVADCLPLALLDPEARVLAAVHAGWRGTAARAVAHAMAAMSRLGATPPATMAFLGPAVHPNSYPVGAEVRRALARAVAPAALHGDVARPDGADHWHVDLVAANRQQLNDAGIGPERVFDCGLTTAHASYFSDRAERPCGRFALMARLLPPPA
ncbi:MAG TPA: polyphenol oxidase family protein [Acidimicrobiales bacterium]|nr:polyphenol oxidase family protein [Acidimicrobiales bacterium]